VETTGVLAVQLRTEIWKHDLKGHGIKLRQKKVNVLLTKVVIPSGENRRETGDLRSRGTCCFADHQEHCLRTGTADPSTRQLIAKPINRLGRDDSH